MEGRRITLQMSHNPVRLITLSANVCKNRLNKSQSVQVQHSCQTKEIETPGTLILKSFGLVILVMWSVFAVNWWYVAASCSTHPPSKGSFA